MNKKALLIFDVDGTLVNSASGTIKALRETMNELFQVNVTDEALLEHYHHHFKTILAHFCPVQDPLILEKAKQLYVKKSMYYSSERNLFPGVYETLKDLSQDFYIATATNLTTNHLKQMMRAFDILQFIDHVRGTESVDEAKPNPAILKESMEIFGADREKSFMIGDSLNDIRAGKNAGIKTIAMCYTGNDAHFFDIVRPDFTVRRFSDIRKIVSDLI